MQPIVIVIYTCVYIESTMRLYHDLYLDLHIISVCL